YFGPDDVNRAIRVAWCVSAFNPAAVNPATGSSGLFQHVPDEWAERSAEAGHPTASIFDPEANVAVAAWMLYELPGGWSHWDCAR
ncbi:MAG: transglycosylase SLT domain-containing protein, partial [Acidimicrobiia bacterium]